jgi:ethanolamine kinase
MAHIIDAWIADDPLVRRLQIVEVVLANCSAVLWPHNPEKVKRTPEWLAKLRTSLKSKTKGLHGNGSTQSFAESSASRCATATPQKKGLNGLSVASADVILLQENVKARQSTVQEQQVSPTVVSLLTPQALQEAEALSNVEAPVSTTQVSSSSLDVPQTSPQVGSTHRQGCSVGSRSSTRSSSNRPHYPEVGADNNRVSGSANRPGPSSFASPGASQVSRRSTEDYYEEHGVPPTAATTRQGGVVVVTENGSPLLETNASIDFASVPLQVKRLSGGITNELFHVYDEEDESASVVVRVFGKETDRVISRESELFYQSLFIRTYVHGNNFLVYDFLDGFYTLPYHEMAAEATPIAHAVAEFQVRATSAALRDHARPLLRDSQNKEYWESFDDELVASARGGGSGGDSRVSTASKEKSRFHHESNYLVDSLTKWVELVLSKEIVQKVLEEKQESFLETAHNLQRECAWMLSVLAKERGSLPEGVCHNDLLSANVMIHSTRKEVRIIDFDYTKRSFLLYDVANHFNEYPGLDCDYDTYFPSDAHMSNFIAEYRKGMRVALERAWHASATANPNLSTAEQEIFPNAKTLFWTESSEAEAAVVVQWTRLAKLLTLASHLSWSVWSLLQEAVSTLDVDFLDYAKARYTRYMDVREECSRGF